MDRRTSLLLRVLLAGVLCTTGLVGCGAGEGADPQPPSTTAPLPTTAPPLSTSTTTGQVSYADYPSDVIRYLQNALDVLGFYQGAHDGLYGPSTADAVKTFQSSKGLPANGQLDGPTAQALAAASPETQIDLVRALQSQLTELGLYRQAIDGVYGEGTRQGVRNLQDAAGLPVTGDIDDKTFAALQTRFVNEVVKGDGGPEPSSTTTAPAGPGLVRPGDDGPEVQSLQQRLTLLGYRPGNADGHFGPATASAVMAFQKHEGLSPDSIVGPAVRSRLEAPTGAGPRDGGAGPRIQVDLDRQIAFFTDGGGAVSIVNVSSGSGEEYLDAGGTTDVAYTPTGDYSVIRVVDGLDVAPLGTLYRPLYFVAGWAVHGSPSVPAYPASHGCVRTSNADQDFLFPRMPLGSPISVYGISRGSPDRAAPGF